MAIREEVVASAVKFLKDPKVSTSPLAKKISFLESKGLSSEEIEEAVSRSATGASTSTTTSTTTTNVSAGAVGAPGSMAPVPGQHQMMPGTAGMPYPQQQPYGPPVPYQGGQPYYPPYGPLPPHQQQQQGFQVSQLGWKDYFIGAVVAMGASYGMFQLIKTYIGPLVSWPTDQKLEVERKRIDEQLSSASTAIAAVKDETEQVVKAMESQATKVNSSLDTMHTILRDLRDLDDKRDVEFKALRDDMENIKTMIPKMLDKTKEAQSSVLTDLQTEIKSLKNLLLNRRLGGASLPIPGLNTADEQDAPAPTSVPAPQSVIAQPPASTVPPVTQTPQTRSIPIKPSIPAWQLEAQAAADAKKAEDAISSAP
ncbi:hypothetical protein SmJEL517_g05558 [Synchytrium microbalum]|uniref:Peroxisomal membrane protein PEX14 n=1 Tax=Synchytrium microbalum TaxID=1806994 RepID=A0A507BNB7_9FUNG|nr:uncharacterized protein SmJEL517_g05558 [Synchytrium microbalum]TPX30997.1 hypothetical protein SmJEL517_g05558 [Synchytrium microbalum]